MRIPEAVGNADLVRLLVVHVHSDGAAVLTDLDLILPQKLPALLFRLKAGAEEHSFPSDEHEPTIVVLQLRATSARILDPVQDLNWRPVLDRLGCSIILQTGRIETYSRELPCVEVARIAQFPDRGVIGKKTQLPGDRGA